jgi:hypothetical protein
MNMNHKKTGNFTLCVGLLAMCLLPGFSKALSWLTPHQDHSPKAGAPRNNPAAREPAGAAQTSATGKKVAPAKAGGWEWLFNGKSTAKWTSVNSDKFPAAGWVIEQGALVMAGKGGGDIITRGKYSNFDLVFDFNLTPGANSGLKYFVGTVKNKQTGKETVNGTEYQIIDDYNHPEVKDHKHEVGSTAAVYLIYAPQNKKLLPAGQWNQARILARGPHVEHWLNGVKVASYEKGSPDFRQRVATTKFRDYAHYGEAASGHIMLTDHGDKVYFRNIKIKRL